MRKGAIGNIDVEIAAKVGMNWEPAILLLFSIPYKLREQSMHERIHPKVLRGIQSLSFFYYLWNKSWQKIEFPFDFCL